MRGQDLQCKTNIFIRSQQLTARNVVQQERRRSVATKKQLDLARIAVNETLELRANDKWVMLQSLSAIADHAAGTKAGLFGSIFEYEQILPVGTECGWQSMSFGKIYCAANPFNPEHDIDLDAPIAARNFAPRAAVYTQNQVFS